MRWCCVSLVGDIIICILFLGLARFAIDMDYKMTASHFIIHAIEQYIPFIFLLDTSKKKWDENGKLKWKENIKYLVSSLNA